MLFGGCKNKTKEKGRSVLIKNASFKQNLMIQENNS